ncbi:MAG: hypothetical protein LUD72_04795, partial [Bacteroidales bacterium]|nr:hypothetical protein [Bacteroidales bacterium]
MACKYNFNGFNGQTYEQLVNRVMSMSMDGTLDLLFSRGNEADIMIDKLKALKDESIKEREQITSMVDGSPDLDVRGSNTFTVQSFIDSQYFQIKGVSPMFKLSTEDYIKQMRTILSDKGLSQEEIDSWAVGVQTRWDTIARDAADWHRMLMLPQSDSPAEWQRRTGGTAYAGIWSKCQVAATEVFKKLGYRGGGKRLDTEHPFRWEKNLNFEAEIRPDITGEPKKLFGHIDYLIVTDSGEVEVFNVKASVEPYEQWAAAKKEKYRYEMALLKRMLAYHGVDARKIRVNIIPVQIKYNSSFTAITDIDATHSAIPIDTWDSSYTFQHYDQVASNFVDSNVDMSGVSSPELMMEVSKQLNFIFPGKDVMAYGITLTAKEWADLHWKECQPEWEPGKGYKLTMPDTGEVLELTDSRKGSNNAQFVKYIEEHIELEKDTESGYLSATRVKNDLKDAFTRGSFISTTRGGRSSYLEEQFSKYLADYTKNPDGTYNYKWKVVDSEILDQANIIALKGPGDQLDVYTLSPVSVEATYQFRPGRDNLLGAYLNDLNTENFTMKANYGNIEAIRTIAILNSIIPNLGTVNLGSLHVIGLGPYQSKKGAYYEFSTLMPQWDSVVRVVNRETAGRSDIKNNFRDLKVATIAPEEGLRQTWEDIADNHVGVSLNNLETVRQIIEGHTTAGGVNQVGLMDIQTVEGKIEKLELLIDELRKLAADRNLPLSRPSDMRNIARAGNNNFDKAIARLFIAAEHALTCYYGDTVVDNETISSLEEYGITPTSIGNSSARRVGFLVQKTIDIVRNKIIEIFMSGPRKLLMDYYKACGYTNAQNALIGNQARVFRNLYQLDENGVNTFLFKNPYNPNSSLQSHERTFLKGMLYELYKIRCRMNGTPPAIKGPEDKVLYESLPANYLFVPLQKASKATMRGDIKRRATQFGKDFHRIFTDPKGYAEELRGYLDNKIVEERDTAIDQMRTYNKYTRSETNIENRSTMISERGVQYWETNLENIYIEFMAQQVQCEENNKLLMRLRGIELDLTLRGIEETGTYDSAKNSEINKIIKYIDDFITLNVYNKSIMEKPMQKVDAWIQPFRRLVSEIYIAANPVGFFRDVMQGIEENFLMAAIKYQTDVNAKDVAFGYKEVFKEGSTNMMTMSRLNQFNIKYGFSNFDAAKVADRLKTGRGGVLNAENWAYWTLRAPDYLNRMVLFIARMHHDGTYNAYSLNEDGRLVYDWRKDERFSALAKNDTSDPKYKEQRSLYMSMIRAFNMENTTRQLAYTDDLPDAYTAEQIRSIKTLGESIYGAYDQSAKAKYENCAIGRNFMFFSTWMNGMVNTYWKKPQVSQSELNLEQETDYNGNKLYFEQNGNITTEDTGVPVLKYVPVMVQGVLNTFGNAISELYHGGWSNFSETWKKDIWGNPINRRNLKRAMTDLMVALMLTILFSYWATPEYKRHKQEDDGKQIFTNMLVELVYKGGKASFDTFKGPVAVVQYLGESTNPATYTLQSKIFNDGIDWVTGKKTTMQTIMGSQAFFRSMQDSYKMYLREQK